VVIAAGAWSPRIEHCPLAAGRARPGQMAAAPWPANMPRAVLYYDHGTSSRGVVRPSLAARWTTLASTEASRVRSPWDRRRSTAAIATAAGGPNPAPGPACAPSRPTGVRSSDPIQTCEGCGTRTGHGRNGVLAASTGEIIGDLVSTGATEVEIASLAPERFTS